MNNTDLIIIGAGPAGATASIYAQRAGLNALVFSGPFGGGQLVQTNDVENYPGFVEPIGGFELMDTVHKQAKRLGAQFVSEEIKSIDSASSPFTITTTNDKTYSAKAVIIATGSRARWLDVAGENKYKGRGVSACATCDGFFYRGKEVVVIGGGNTAFEDALFLSKICKKVYLVHRRAGFRAAQKTVDIAKANPKIEMLIPYVAQEVIGDDNGVTALKIKNVADGSERSIDCQGVFVAVGGIPQTDFLQGSNIALWPGGEVKVDERCRTNIEGIFAAGDCADIYFRQAVIAAGNGAKAAIEAINYINLK
ncbi:thioredoxin reductase (NADPH) [Elusimicrobium posterum]|uniref:thioredoxin-disulfide reductase n=1 Tax=Elusimicrobium posterum TaxID=3116653 RepID=UPI003C76F67D